MKDVFNNIDELILTKSYKDLSAGELSDISEMASNESDFNQLKATLLAVQKQITTEETIEARPETKAALMKEFKATRPAVIASSSKMGLGFFFPKGPLAKMPGLQILTAAACLLMIFTVFRNMDLKGENGKMAYQETTEEQKSKLDSEIKSEVVTKKELEEEGKDIATDSEILTPGETTDLVREELADTDVMADASEKDFINKDDSPNDLTSDGTVQTGTSATKFVTPTVDAVAMEKVVTSEDEIVDMISDEVAIIQEEEAEEEVLLETVSKESVSDDKAFASRTTNAGSANLELADAAVSPQSAKDSKKKADQTPIKLSRTLEEDAELIDLFYTAM